MSLPAAPGVCDPLAPNVRKPGAGNARLAPNVRNPKLAAPLVALGPRGDRQQAREDSAFEHPIEARAQNRLAEWPDVEQEREHSEDREGDGQLLPDLQLLPPQDDAWRRPGRLAHACHSRLRGL